MKQVKRAWHVIFFVFLIIAFFFLVLYQTDSTITGNVIKTQVDTAENSLMIFTVIALFSMLILTGIFKKFD